MTLKTSLILNAVLAAALVFALAAWFGKSAAVDKAVSAAIDWPQVAAKGSAAYVKSHGGALPKGTSFLNDNGKVYVVGYSGSN